MRSTQNVGLWALLLGLIAVGPAGCGFSEPPEQQAENFIAAVQRGMTWEQVTAVKPPGRYAPASLTAMGGHKQLQPYDEKIIRDSLASQDFTEGFLFHYRFTADHTYQVWFDETGKVVSIQKERSMGDLLR